MTASPKVRRGYVDGRYGQIHVYRAAPALVEKPAIVCLHMSPRSGRVYQDVLPLLADRREALALDYPGFGESDPPPADPPVTIEDYAASVWDVVDASVGEPVYLLGYHTGSLVSVEAAHQRPGGVRGIISISAPIFSDSELEAIKKQYQSIPLDEEGTRFKRMWQMIMQHRGPGTTLEMAARSLLDHLRGGERYEWGHRAAFEYAPRYPQRLSALGIPVLVLNPNDDLVEQTRRVDQHLVNGRRVECPGWGHGFLSAHDRAAAELILDFLTEVES